MIDWRYNALGDSGNGRCYHPFRHSFYIEPHVKSMWVTEQAQEWWHDLPNIISKGIAKAWATIPHNAPSSGCSAPPSEETPTEFMSVMQHIKNGLCWNCATCPWASNCRYTHTVRELINQFYSEPIVAYYEKSLGVKINWLKQAPLIGALCDSFCRQCNDASAGFRMTVHTTKRNQPAPTQLPTIQRHCIQCQLTANYPVYRCYNK